jgi:hypothetical protein
MPKPRKGIHINQGATLPCPNPSCTRNKSFTKGQFKHHLAKQVTCRDFLAQQCAQLVNSTIMNDDGNNTDATGINPNMAAMPNNVNMDFNFVFPDSRFACMDDSASVVKVPPAYPTATSKAPAVDYAQCNFIMLDEKPKDNFIINSDAAIFTNDVAEWKLFF